ncbi:MAG: response regulator transcription factor [Myxococcota bacterium]|nr:response regulator transcription factor [Myxococcota bacterium]
MTETASILVIDDEPHARALLQMTLGQAGYCCLRASTGIEGIRTAENSEPNLVILDLGLPDLSGVEVAKRIRERSAAPIIVLSASGQESDKISALDGGANDYVTKPFAVGEFLARVRAALRPASSSTAGKAPSGVLTFGDLSVDFDARRVTKRDRLVRLTPTEYRLLAVMLSEPGRLLTHQRILRQVWGPRCASDMNYLRVYMKRVRLKIEDEPLRPKYLVNETGVGYRFSVPA